MNIADSMKTVLKHKSQDIFSDMWRNDLKNILADTAKDLTRFFRSGKVSLRNLKTKDIKINLKELKDSATDTILIFKVMPGRIKDGFLFFKEDLYRELSDQPDSKQKTIFSLKVLGALTSFILGSVYGLKIGKSDFSLAGLKRRNAFTQFIVAEIIFKVSQLFMQRFLTEVEKEVTDPDELKNLRYFKELITDRSKIESHEFDQSFIKGDEAIQIVENLKSFVMTGNRT